MKSLKSQNFYEVLGVPRHATAEEIRAAYEISRHTFQENSLATYSLFTDQENEEILALISKAYETLFNPEMRRAYDSQLDRQDAEARPQRRPAPPAPAVHAAQQGAPAAQPGSAQQLAFGALRRPVEDLEARPALGAMEMRPAPGAMAAAAPTMTMPAPAPPPHPEIRPTPPRPVPPAATVREPNPQAAEFAKALVFFDGASLKKLRQMHGITLEELSERTKIRRAYLQYLEEEQFQFLPAAVYVKGFVSIVAGILGVPPQRAAEDYMTRYQGRDR
jgi:curved DNA-binding protein CbpA